MLQPRREDAFLSLSDQIIASIAEAFDEADWPDGRNSTGGSTPDRRPCWLELSEWDLDEERVWEYNASSVYELPAHMAASLRAPWFRYSGVIRFLYPEPPNSDGRVYRKQGHPRASTGWYLFPVNSLKSTACDFVSAQNHHPNAFFAK